MVSNIIKFFLENKLVTSILLIVFIVWGIISAPFGWDTGILPRDPVPVDAIPNIGENQQIVYTEWSGRSPQDIEDQISYPLTTALLGIPGVKSIRSNSIFGASNIYIIFDEDVDFYWSRTRILEKLNSLPQGTLPEGVSPTLGPDATALGQIYWYTLEGRDKNGNPAGGWDPHELRTIQDFYVKYGLTAAKGVSEVSSIGGFVKEYQVDIDPRAMKAHGVNISQVISAVKHSNLDIGARTLEFNRVEYLIRSLGYIEDLEDLENSVVAVNNNTPVKISDIAKVQYGPAPRRGGLDKSGAEAVGGVVVARYGTNPMEAINNVKDKIKEISPGLPSKTLEDGTVSKVTIVPFYDRTGLIKETLGTLEEALTFAILISIIVIIVLVVNLRASFLISILLPIGVLITFIVMRQFGVTANIVALSGIAISIGVMIDVGVVITENIIRHLNMPQNKNARGGQLLNVVFEGTREVSGAVLTALTTTIISFLPVFTMQAAEGKLFRPLAFTKTFAIIAALVIGLIIIPMLAHIVFSIRVDKKKIRKAINLLLMPAGAVLAILSGNYVALALSGIGLNNYFGDRWPDHRKNMVNYINVGITILVVLYFLSYEWLPLGANNSLLSNILFVVAITGLILGVLLVFSHFYPAILKWSLANKWKFLVLPIFFVLFGIVVWQGFGKIFGFLPNALKKTGFYESATEHFPGLGKEFMPALDEGSFLLMPTTMPHSGIEENIEVIRMLDKKVNSIPEVEQVVGKWGRVNSALDPAPISMFENIINYRPEYILDEDGRKVRFKVVENGWFLLDTAIIGNENIKIDKDRVELEKGMRYDNEIKQIMFYNQGAWQNAETIFDQQILYRLSTHFRKYLINDDNGEYFRNWRKEIQTSDDIWEEIVKQSNIPGLTSAPKLQPIQTRLVMLQTGMRAPMGIKVYGPDLKTIENFGFKLEEHLKKVEGVKPASVFADRVVGKPYLEINIKRNELARYGIKVEEFQKYVSTTIGGMPLTTTVEGRERFPVRARYAREFRDQPSSIENILIPARNGEQIPLSQLADIEYRRGPQMIKSENTFLVAYVIFDKKDGYAEVDVVENAQDYLDREINDGNLIVPKGINYVFTGNYENQIRATKRLMLVVPISLLVIFLIIYFQFSSVNITTMIFSGILVAFSGGFIILWLYGQPWFLDMTIGGQNLRDMFQVHTINLSVAIWVGFIALFGIATDNGVLIATYLKQVFNRNKPESKEDVRAGAMEAGKIRIRPAMMTTATTIIALLPVLMSTGKGSDIMVPMAIPIFGGMVMQVITVIIVPVLFSMWKEKQMDNKKVS